MEKERKKEIKDRIINIILIALFLIGITLPVILSEAPENYTAIKGNPLLLYSTEPTCRLLLGRPNKTEVSDLTGARTLTYKRKIFSYDARVEYEFRTELRSVYAKFKVNDKDPYEVYREVRDYIYESFSKRHGFVDNGEEGYYHSFSFSKDRLNTIRASVSLDDNEITVYVYV